MWGALHATASLECRVPKKQQNPTQNGRKRQTGFSSHASIAASFTSQTGSRYAESQAVHSHSPTTYPFFRRKNEKFPRKRADQWAVLADRRHHGLRWAQLIATGSVKGLRRLPLVLGEELLGSNRHPFQAPPRLRSPRLPPHPIQTQNINHQNWR
jgi:hypothetical protein